MTEPSEHNLIEAAQRLRRESDRALDTLTVARLRAARLATVAEKHGRPWRLAGALATGAVTLALAGVIWLKTSPNLPAPPPVDEATTADVDLLASGNPEFYSDLDFYRWLASRSGRS